MTTPNDPPIEEPDEREGNLREVTDEQWREGHEALRRSGSIPEEELAHIWDPALDPATLIGPDERDAAPAEEG